MLSDPLFYFSHDPQSFYKYYFYCIGKKPICLDNSERGWDKSTQPSTNHRMHLGRYFSLVANFTT